MFPIELLGVKTKPAKSGRNLGVIFDKNFTFRSHISAVCSSCFYHMRDLQRIRRHRDLDSAKLLATALASSRLDYCNSLLYGIADMDLTRLQCVRNQQAALVTKSPPFTRSLSLLHSLHWGLDYSSSSSLDYCLRSICWPTNLCVKNSLFIFTPCLPHRFLPVHWDQDQYWCKGFSLLCPISLEQPATVCQFIHFSCYLQEISEDTSLWLGLPLPIDTVMPHGLLMLRNCFLDFSVEHWF